MPVTISGTTGIQTPGVANSGTSTAALFSGPLAGNVTGNASTATLATSATTAVVATSASPSSTLGLATCKAWVNFNGAEGGINTVFTGGTGGFGSIVVTAGSDIGTWSITGALPVYIGQIYYIRSVGGVANATLGGRGVSNNGLGTFNPYTGIQIISQTTNSYGIKLVEGPATVSQTASVYTAFITGIRSAYNVSSVTRNATGDYTINFATPMADAYYAISGAASGQDFNGFVGPYPGIAPTTTGVRVGTQIYTNALRDQSQVSIAIFGN